VKISREQVVENRRRILDAAARMFRERGFEAVTVAEVMKAAGLTHGAFYGHFDSKDELIAQAFEHVSVTARAAAGEALAAGSKPQTLKDFAAFYLRQDHRDDAGSGCLFSALGTEAARCSPEARHVLTESIQHQIDDLSRTAPGKTAAARRRAAIGSWSAMIGAVLVARIADDPALSDEFMAETRAWLGA
jgi:TetR/AcrR family transcriptional repressor of nem operon